MSLFPPGAPQHVSILMPIQLTEDNYLVWKSLFIPILKAHDMLNLAEGREQCPPQFLTGTSSDCEEDKQKEDLAYTNWIKRDQIFLTWINASVSASLLRYTREFTSGRALWLHLENLLAKDATSRVLGLKARLQNLDKRRYGKMKKYIDSAQQIADELEVAGSPIDDDEYIYHILEGLLRPSEHYENIVATIKNRMPLTRQEVHGLLLRLTTFHSICQCLYKVLLLLVLVPVLLLLIYKLFKR